MALAGINSAEISNQYQWPGLFVLFISNGAIPLTKYPPAKEPELSIWLATINQGSELQTLTLYNCYYQEAVGVGHPASR